MQTGVPSFVLVLVAHKSIIVIILKNLLTIELRMTLFNPYTNAHLSGLIIFL